MENAPNRLENDQATDADLRIEEEDLQPPSLPEEKDNGVEAAGQQQKIRIEAFQADLNRVFQAHRLRLVPVTTIISQAEVTVVGAAHRVVPL